MSGLIPEDRIQQVLDAVDIVELIGREVELKTKGADFWGLCPFHDEDTPSFHVRPETGSYYCFGCNAGGTAIKWVMERLGMTFPEAVRMLASEHGIQIEESPDRERSASSGGRARVLDALAWAAGFFHRQLGSPEAAGARSYLTDRGFRRDLVLSFKLGYAPDSWDALRTAGHREGFGDDVLEGAGLVVRKEEGSRCYDRFRGRLMFPIGDVASRIIGFGARILGDGEPKYLNSPDGPLFNKGRTLFGLDRAKTDIRKRKAAVLVEGYTDVLMAHQVGLENVVAGLGTALTPDHARLLRRFTETVVLLYDGDSAGRTAAERAFGIFLEEELDVRVALLEGGRDPCEIALEEGPEGLSSRVDAASDAATFMRDGILRRGESASARSAALDDALDVVARVQNPVRRELLLKELADGAGVRVESLLSRLRERGGRRPTRPTARPVEEPEMVEEDRSPPPRAEAWALEAALDDPELRMADLAGAPLRSGAARRIAQRAAGLLRDGKFGLDLLMAGLTDWEQSLVMRLVSSGRQKSSGERACDLERQFLDSLARIRTDAEPDPEDLLKDAVARGDQEAIERLISRIRGRSE